MMLRTGPGTQAALGGDRCIELLQGGRRLTPADVRDAVRAQNTQVLGR